jgi:hypothetical protein
MGDKVVNELNLSLKTAPEQLLFYHPTDITGKKFNMTN